MRKRISKQHERQSKTANTDWLDKFDWSPQLPVHLNRKRQHGTRKLYEEARESQLQKAVYKNITTVDTRTHGSFLGRLVVISPQKGEQNKSVHSCHEHAEDTTEKHSCGKQCKANKIQRTKPVYLIAGDAQVVALAQVGVAVSKYAGSCLQEKTYEETSKTNEQEFSAQSSCPNVSSSH